MNKNKINTLSLFIILTIVLYCQKSFSQHHHSGENEEYIHDKEIELSNDSSYWENAAVFYLGFNKTGFRKRYYRDGSDALIMEFIK